MTYLNKFVKKDLGWKCNKIKCMSSFCCFVLREKLTEPVTFTIYRFVAAVLVHLGES